jgi:serine/threonine protein kinase
MELKLGYIINDQYRVDSFLGKGAMASVYQVWDIKRLVPLAMKVLSDDLAEDIVFLRRFKREAETLKQLQHPNIVRFYELGQDDDLVYMLMDYVDGSTLRSEINQNRGKPFSAERISQVIGPICAGLHYAHQQNVIHCDIKPANIMLDSTGRVLIADFGIARLSDAATTTMVGAGTPAYMSPEQSKGKKPTPASDIYAVGTILYEMLTGGERPFTGERSEIGGSNAERILWEKLNLEPIPPTQYNPNLSPTTDRIITRCLAIDPVARYQDTLPFFSDIQNSLGMKDNTLTPSSVIPQIPQTQEKPDFDDETGAGLASSSYNYAKTGSDTEDPLESQLPSKHGKRFVITALICIFLIFTFVFSLVSANKVIKTNHVNSTNTAIIMALNESRTREANLHQTQSMIAGTANVVKSTQTAVAENATATYTAMIARETISAEETKTAKSKNLLTDAQFNWDTKIFDAFSTNYNNWLTGTKSDDWGRRSFQLRNGEYNVTYSAKKPAIVWVYLIPYFDDAYISVDLQMFPAAGNSDEMEAGIIFGYSSRQHFLYELSSDGGCDLSGYNEASDSWTTFYTSPYCGLVDTMDDNKLEIVAKDNMISLFLNGDFVDEEYIPEYSSGEIGLAVGLSSTGDYGDFYFDNFEVHVP